MPNNKKKTRTANKEGCIYYDKKRNYWRYTITLPTGERVSFCDKKRSKAVEKKNAFVDNGYEKVNKTPKKTNKKIIKSHRTIVDCCYGYIEKEFAKGSFKANTYNRHEDTIKRIKKSKLSLIPIEELTIEDINEFLGNQFHYAKDTQLKNRAMLKWGFIYAIDNKIPVKNLMQSRDIKKPPKSSKRAKKEALTIEEQERFLEVLKQVETDPKYQMYTYMCLLLFYTGMRPGELCALKLSDINFNERKINILRTTTKNKNKRFIIGEETKTESGERQLLYGDIVNDLMQKILSTRNPNTEFLFADDYGHFLTPPQLWRRINILNKKYNIAKGLTSYALRHTFATRMYEQDIKIFEIQHMLGHSSIEVTLDTYTSFSINTEKKVVQKMDNYYKSIAP